MKIVLFDDYVIGAMRGDQVVDLRPALGDIPDLPADERILALIADYDSLRHRLQAQLREAPGIPVATSRFRPPIPRPPKFLCAIGNYPQPGQEPPGFIDFFFKSPESVIGPGQTIELPAVEASMYQYEASLAVVIGRPAHDVAEAAGLSYVFGYTGFIDVFGRDIGRPVGTYWAKSFDTFGPMGPCLVTADEIDPQALEVRLRLNGQVRQSYSTSAMLYAVPALVAAASGIITLYPGDLLGCGSDQRGLGPLTDGDRVELAITGIGDFEVNVSDPQKRTWPREVASGGRR